MGKEIVYCDECGVQIPGGDFETGRAATVANRNFCNRCRPSEAVTTATRTPPPQKKTSTGPVTKTATPGPRRATTPRPKVVARDKTSTSRVGPFVRPREGIPKGILIGGIVVAVVLVGILLVILGMNSGGEPTPQQNGSSAGPQNGGSGPTPPQTNPLEDRATQAVTRARQYQTEHPGDLQGLLAYINQQMAELRGIGAQATPGYAELEQWTVTLQADIEVAGRRERAEQIIAQVDRYAAEDPPNIEAIEAIGSDLEELRGLAGMDSYVQRAEEARRRAADRFRSRLGTLAAEVRGEALDYMRRSLFSAARRPVSELMRSCRRLQELTGEGAPQVESQMQQLLEEIEDAEERDMEQTRPDDDDPRPDPGPDPTPQPAGDPQTINGRLENGDQTLEGGRYADAHNVQWTQGDRIVIEMSSSDFDTLVAVVGENGRFQRENDDISQNNLNSRLEFTVPSTGSFQIIATAYEARATGAYTIRVTVSR